MNCIFGLFDVLGFTSFCENCDSLDAARVLKIIDDFEVEMPDLLMDGLDTNKEIPKDKKELLKQRLKWLTFSDTFFVAMPIHDSGKTESKFDLIYFTMLVAYMNRRMFEIGLPLRGAVHIGEVTLSKRCFAGKAIMYAHRLSEKCQLAGTIVSQEAHEFICNVFSEPKGYHFMYSQLIVECEVPIGTKRVSKLLCGNESEKMKTLCWFILELGNIEPFVMPADLGRFVQDKFTAHGKTLSGEREKMKAFNTEQLFRDWQAAMHQEYRHEISMTFPDGRQRDAL